MVDVIGAGRVGSALQARARARGNAGTLVTRNEGWEALAGSPGPVLVATRADDLPAVVARVPSWRGADLVFVQNGMIRPLLAEHGLRDATRGILFVAASRRGEDLDVGGTSPFCGPRAATMVAWLQSLDVAAEVVTPEAFAAVELEKLIWNSAFGLLCQALDATVGQVCDRHRATLRALVAELVAVGAPALGVQVDLDELLVSLCAYSRSIAGWRGAVKEWRWRNGWFVEEAARRGVALPTHAAVAARAGVP